MKVSVQVCVVLAAFVVATSVASADIARVDYDYATSAGSGMWSVTIPGSTDVVFEAPMAAPTFAQIDTLHAGEVAPAGTVGWANDTTSVPPATGMTWDFYDATDTVTLNAVTPGWEHLSWPITTILKWTDGDDANGTNRYYWSADVTDAPPTSDATGDWRLASWWGNVVTGEGHRHSGDTEGLGVGLDTYTDDESGYLDGGVDGDGIGFAINCRDASNGGESSLFVSNVEFGGDVFADTADVLGGELPPPPQPIPHVDFTYDSATKGGTISGMVNTTAIGGPGELLFTGVMPEPNTFDPHAADDPPITPAGAIGTVTEQSGEHNTDGKAAGITWDGVEPVTLTASHGGTAFSVKAQLIFGPSGDDSYDNPGEDPAASYDPVSGPHFSYDFQIEVSDDALAEHGGDAVSPGGSNNPRMAVWFGVGEEDPNGLAHRLTQDEELFIVGPDAYTETPNNDDDWSKFAAGQPLSIYYGWRDRDNIGDGSFQVDSIMLSGSLPVDMATMVPEPGTLVMAALALLLLGGYGVCRRRRV